MWFAMWFAVWFGVILIKEKVLILKVMLFSFSFNYLTSSS